MKPNKNGFQNGSSLIRVSKRVELIRVSKRVELDPGFRTGRAYPGFKTGFVLNSCPLPFETVLPYLEYFKYSNLPPAFSFSLTVECPPRNLCSLPPILLPLPRHPIMPTSPLSSPPTGWSPLPWQVHSFLAHSLLN